MGVVESRGPPIVEPTKATMEHLESDGSGSTKGQNILQNVRYHYLDDCAETATILEGYKLGEELGKGTSGKVMEGVHVVTGDKVAIKIIRKSSKHRNAAVPEEELRCLRLLRNDNVVKLLAVCDTPKSLYIVMEKCDTDLLSLLNATPFWLTEMTAASLFAQLLEGVRFCHSLGVCHRDLKLENLLLSGGVVKIADFGLSKFVDVSNQLQSYAGSPQYLAPELVQDTLPSFDGLAADMWSCGVALYALLFRGLPFDDESLEGILHNIQRGKYTTTRPITDDARDLLDKLLQRDPAKRLSAQQGLEHPWIISNLQGPPDQIIPGIEIKVTGVKMDKALSTDTVLASAAHRLALKRKAEAAGLRVPTIPAAIGAPHMLRRCAVDDSFAKRPKPGGGATGGSLSSNPSAS